MLLSAIAPAASVGPSVPSVPAAKKVILLHAPKRKYFDDDPAWGEIPSIQSEIALIKGYGAEVIGVALNTNGCTIDEARKYKLELEHDIRLPVVLPLEDGISDLITPILKLVG